LLLPPTIMLLLSSFLALNTFNCPQKNIYRKCSAFASSALCTYFSRKAQSFCWRDAQEYFLPQGGGYPSYATVSWRKKFILLLNNGSWTCALRTLYQKNCLVLVYYREVIEVKSLLVDRF